MALTAATGATARATTADRGRIDSTVSDGGADGTIMALAQLVRTALGLKQAGGVSSHYEQIVQQLRGSTDPLALTNLYAALTHNVSVLGATPAKFSALLDAAFMFSWAVADDALVAAFINFLCHMVSANSCFLVPSFRVLLRNLCPPEASTEADFKHLEARAAPIHDTLRTILRLVPTGTRSLFNVVQDRFPHRRLDLPVHAAFVTHALRIADDVPALRDRLLMLIVDRMIQIDVEIKLEDVPDSAVAGAKDQDVEQLLFPMDDVPEGDDTAGGAATGAGAVGGIAATDDMAKKLDALMGILFAYVKRHMVAAMSSQLLQSNGTVVDAPQEPPPAAAQTFRSLLRTFERVVLTTHKSKYTQFLMFYAAQFHPTFPDAFVGRLIDTMRADSCPAVTRQSCAAYLGSFLARATYVDESTLKSAFCFVMEWIQHYMSAAATSARLRHASSHRVFYAICQSAFYVVCFHHRTLHQNADGTPFLGQFRWDAILLSPLLVIKHCAEAISREFLRVCRHLRLVDRRVLAQSANAKLHPLAAVTEAGSGKPSGSDGGADAAAGAGAGGGAGSGAMTGVVDEAARAGGMGSGLNPLDSFFPFDPYLLRNSSSYINGLYRWWRGLGVDSDDEDSGSDGEGATDSEAGSVPSSSVASGGGGGVRPSSIGLGVGGNPGGGALRTPGGMRRARGFSFDVHPGVPAAESGGPSFGDGDDDSLASSPALGTPLDDDLMAGSGLMWRRDRGVSYDGGGDESASFLGEGDSDIDDSPAVMVRGRPVVRGKGGSARRGRVGSASSASDSDDEGAGGGRQVRGARGRMASGSGDDDDSLPGMSLGTTPVRHTGGLPGATRAGHGEGAGADPGAPFVRRTRQGSTDSATFVDGWGDDDF